MTGPRPLARLVRCARGLAPVATMELRRAGALGRGQAPTMLRQRSHDLLFLAAPKRAATTRDCRTLEESFVCPAYGRFKVTEAQLDRTAAACGDGPVRIAVSVEGKRFDRRDFDRFVSRTLADRGVKVVTRGPARLFVFAIDDAFYFGLRDGVWHDASGRRADGPGREAAAPPDLAAAMAFLLKPDAGERVADLCCGTGALLAEFRAYAPDAALIGRDVDRGALTIARRRFRGAPRVDLKIGDGTATDLAPDSVTAFVINPPFGVQMGDSVDNPALYAALIAEMRRIGAAQGWRAAILTSDAAALDAALDAHRGGIAERRRIALRLRGLDAVMATIVGGVF